VNAVDRETLDIFERSVRGVLGAAGGDDATAALEETGWRDILVADARAVVPLVFGLLGELRTPAAVLDDVALTALRPGSEEWLAEMGDAAFVHPRPGAAFAARAAGAGIVVDGIARRETRDGELMLVVGSDDGHALVIVSADDVECTPIGGLDPSMALLRVRGTVAPARVTAVADVALDGVVPACRRALAYEMNGCSTAMLALATEYAGARVQFGQPIGGFQAVKHRLADVYVATRAASVVADESWESDPAVTATAAKALAGRATRVASENCLQVLGAIGFTEEHDLHRFARRGQVLDALYGSGRELEAELGRVLLARGRAPRPGVL